MAHGIQNVFQSCLYCYIFRHLQSMIQMDVCCWSFHQFFSYSHVSVFFLTYSLALNPERDPPSLHHVPDPDWKRVDGTLIPAHPANSRGSPSLPSLRSNICKTSQLFSCKLWSTSQRKAIASFHKRHFHLYFLSDLQLL